ncbi:MAG TPA: hypothetical protein PLR02_07270 [Rhodocyclaceae bacterium]|nr:hypothetical protein [Rhodocyclaceae bacterium]
MSKTSPQDVPFSARIVLTHYSLTQLRRTLGGLAAIEQLLRVPVPDDAGDDNGQLAHVYRDDLCELLGTVCQQLQDKTEFLIELAEANQQEVLQQ